MCRGNWNGARRVSLSIFLYPFWGTKGWTIDRGKEQKTE